MRLPHADHQTEELDERGVGGREAFRLLAQSRHLRVLAGVVAFAAIGAAVVDQQLSMAAEGTGADGDAIAKLLAQVTIYLSLAGFLVQIGLTSRIHRSFGIAVALLLLPIGLGTSATLILLTGELWAVAGARVLDTTLRYSLDKTTREVLFLPLPADLRFRAKPFIDVTMDRFGKAARAAIILVLIHPRALGLDWRQLSYASLIVMAGWIAMALVAWREYIRAFRASIVSQGISPTQHPHRRRRHRNDRDAGRGTVEPGRTLRDLRDRPARSARQAQPGHATSSSKRIASSTGEVASRHGRSRFVDRSAMDPDHRADGPGRRR